MTVLNLSVVTFLVMLGLSIVAPILPNYAENFGVSYTLVGFVISAFALTRMVLDIPAGFLSRTYDKKRIMILGLILIVASSIMAGMAETYVTLVIARMIEGAGSALYVTTATVFLAQIAGTERRGRLMSIYSGMLLLGSVFGPSFGGFVAVLYDIRAPFFAYAIVAGFGVIPTLALPRSYSSSATSSGREKRSSIGDVLSVLSYGSFATVTLATFTLFFIRTGVRSTLVPLFAANNLGTDSTAIGLVLTIAGATTAATMVPMGDLSDRIGRRNPLILCLLLTAAVTMLIPVANDMLQLSVSMAAYGATVGMSGPIAAYVTDVSPPDKIEVSMGLYRMISDVGYVAGPLLLGYVADRTTAVPSGPIGLMPFAVASAIMIAAGLSLLKAQDPARKKDLQPILL